MPPVLISLPGRCVLGVKLAPAPEIDTRFIDEFDVADPITRVGECGIKGILSGVMLGVSQRGEQLDFVRGNGTTRRPKRYDSPPN
jgi:hypothetical protein